MTTGTLSFSIAVQMYGGHRARGSTGFMHTDLQNEVTVAGVAQAQVLLVQVPAKPAQVVVLPADVCGQD